MKQHVVGIVEGLCFIAMALTTSAVIAQPIFFKFIGWFFESS